MKKKYLTPEVEMDLVALEANFLASGENLTSRSYGSEVGEDEDCFWE